MYAVRGEGLSRKVGDLVLYSIVTCVGKTLVAASDRMMRRRGLQTITVLLLMVAGFSVITST